ncbi:MAG TPA: BON domain-containing protein [Marinagarivorans sp.]
MNKCLSRLANLALACLVTATLSGCSSFLAATYDGPIEQDPGQRTRGKVIDDREITTLLKVNLVKADPSLDDANIAVLCYNGVVLLAGQVPSNELRELAGDTARNINAVRQVHNQLTVASKATIYSRANDNWIGTKIRAKLFNSTQVESNRVKILVENRVVYIMGLLTESETQHVTELARTTEGVDKVVRAVELVPEHERAPHF